MTDKTALGDRMNAEYGDSRLPARIWEKIEVDPLNGCWLWNASKRQSGYGQFHYNKRARTAHTTIYEVLVGPRVPGMDLDHLCRVRHCVNPAHLPPVSRQENLARGVDLVWMERAARTHCPQGHPYSGDNLGHDGRGRRCRTCDARRKREYKARKKAERDK